MYPPARESNKVCRLSLFTWTCAESEEKEVVPVCPKHPESKTSFGNFGTGIKVTCNEDRDHLIGLCSREQFEAERQEARIRLYPRAPRGSS
jgi:hypothetical protein